MALGTQMQEAVMIMAQNTGGGVPRDRTSTSPLFGGAYCLALA